MIYSNFVHAAGIMDFAALLALRGWEEWTEDTKGRNSRRYAVISGDVDVDERTIIQKVASAADNIHGDIIRLVLVGPAGAEGIEFHNFRYVVIMDPFFNAIRSEQAENRIDRYKSHVLLPKRDQTVQTYYLLSTYPEIDVSKKSAIKQAKELPTDEYLYIQSKRRKLMSLEFYKLLVEASIDCPIHREQLPAARAKKIHCLMCNPTNRPLFTDRLDKDVNTANPCRVPEVARVKAKEIIIDHAGAEHKYMYSKDGDETLFFEYKDDLGGYIPVARNHEDYAALVDAVGHKK
jgi:hypothetical protein